MKFAQLKESLAGGEVRDFIAQCDRCGAAIKYVFRCGGKAYGSECINKILGYPEDPKNYVMRNGEVDIDATKKKRQDSQKDIDKRNEERRIRFEIANSNVAERLKVLGDLFVKDANYSKIANIPKTGNAELVHQLVNSNIWLTLTSGDRINNGAGSTIPPMIGFQGPGFAGSLVAQLFSTGKLSDKQWGYFEKHLNKMVGPKKANDILDKIHLEHKLFRNAIIAW